MRVRIPPFCSWPIGWLLAVLALAMPVVTFPTAAHAETIIEITELQAHDLQRRVFRVGRPIDVQVEAVGAALQRGEALFAYPWIIDARTRALVWSMDDEITEPVKGTQWLRRFADQLRLQEGVYELYYYAGGPDFFPGDFSADNLAEVFKRLGEWFGRAGKDRKDSLDALAARYLVRISGESDALNGGAAPPVRDTVVRILHPGNDAYLQDGFSLAADVDLDVYAVGEYSEGSDAFVDWSWIASAATGQPVWEMEEDNTDWAGGAAKNRRHHDRVRLPAGDYIAYYVTDDSHTYGDWNAAPPVDPEGWGLQAFLVHGADRMQVRPYEERRHREALLTMIGIGDNELRSQAFRLSRPAALRIYAIGEYDRYDDRMADYAWVVRAADRSRVWTMASANTSPAGGAAKNRQFDGVVDFASDDYIVYYSSDGSHSYGGGWSSSPPHDQRFYGVSLYAAGTLEPGVFSLVTRDGTAASGALAAITRVGSDEEREERFTLKSLSRVRIHAVGEGDRDDMRDYGWIEDVGTGDVVWEMTYRKTSDAGGAEENRVVDQVILLDKGEYVVHYVTDGSHAYGDWNDDRPDDPEAWGITVTLAAKVGK